MSTAEYVLNICGAYSAFSGADKALSADARTFVAIFFARFTTLYFVEFSRTE